jgi:putative transcriptional regulator
MSEPGALVGRDELIAEVVREIKKGKHVVLTGAVGIGKSAVLQAALKIIEPRPSEWYQFDPVAYEAGEHPEALEGEQRLLKVHCSPAGGRIPSATGPCSAPLDVKAIRAQVGMSQAEFSAAFGISLGTLRHWEQGDRQPRGPARVLLTLLAKEPIALLKVLKALAA